MQTPPQSEYRTVPSPQVFTVFGFVAFSVFVLGTSTPLSVLEPFSVSVILLFQKYYINRIIFVTLETSSLISTMVKANAASVISAKAFQFFLQGRWEDPSFHSYLSDLWKSGHSA